MEEDHCDDFATESDMTDNDFMNNLQAMRPKNNNDICQVLPDSDVDSDSQQRIPHGLTGLYQSDSETDDGTQFN